MKKQVTKIRTLIKFYKGLDNASDKVYGFVTKTKGCWRGCRESAEKKKIVFLDSSVKTEIIPGVLYKCTLHPMSKGDGFIAFSASVVKFKAVVTTSCKNGVYKVLVRFGNRVVMYDPSSKDPKENDIKRIYNMLIHRNDLKDPMGVARDFMDSACLALRMYEQEKYQGCFARP